ncbi:hypothetical protein Bbelb_036840 [Branchiostoma belcheri]|nr:hypothetical protein Bbelb_036840 [Branchiostoma belcheri]
MGCSSSPPLGHPWGYCSLGFVVACCGIPSQERCSLGCQPLLPQCRLSVLSTVYPAVTTLFVVASQTFLAFCQQQYGQNSRTALRSGLTHFKGHLNTAPISLKRVVAALERTSVRAILAGCHESLVKLGKRYIPLANVDGIPVDNNASSLTYFEDDAAPPSLANFALYIVSTHVQRVHLRQTLRFAVVQNKFYDKPSFCGIHESAVCTEFQPSSGVP